MKKAFMIIHKIDIEDMLKTMQSEPNDLIYIDFKKLPRANQWTYTGSRKLISSQKAE